MKGNGPASQDEARPATIKTIAENLGLTANTVSRALRGMGYVSPTTHERVHAEAQRLGYVPNAAARALVLGSANNLGLVITNPSNPIYSELISAVERRSRQHGYTLNLSVTEESTRNEELAVDAMLRWRVNGVIVVPAQGADDPWERLLAGGIPLVCVNRPLLGIPSDVFGVDYEQGAYDAASHMLDRGYWPLQVFEEDLDITTVHSRIAGIRRAFEDRGKEFREDDLVRVESPRENDSTLPWEPQSAYEWAQLRLRSLPRGAGVIAGNDFLALGVYRAASEYGLHVPEDLGICGQGDHPFSAFLDPGLTTVRAPVHDIGVAAVDRIVERIRRDATQLEPVHRPFPAELVVRGSTLPNRSGEAAD
ncbi:MAG: LacI family DNA-binding transcriptional regulator [Protaetiibacter sp.]